MGPRQIIPIIPIQQDHRALPASLNGIPVPHSIVPYRPRKRHRRNEEKKCAI
jgi:hypothetical protein